jgi:hypothetical protein
MENDKFRQFVNDILNWFILENPDRYLLIYELLGIISRNILLDMQDNKKNGIINGHDEFIKLSNNIIKRINNLNDKITSNVKINSTQIILQDTKKAQITTTPIDITEKNLTDTVSFLKLIFIIINSEQIKNLIITFFKNIYTTDKSTSNILITKNELFICIINNLIRKQIFNDKDLRSKISQIILTLNWKDPTTIYTVISSLGGTIVGCVTEAGLKDVKNTLLSYGSHISNTASNVTNTLSKITSKIPSKNYHL